MSKAEGESIGSVSDVGLLGDEWSFTLYDGHERELLALAFETEQDARAAAKAMQDVLARAVALSPAEEFAFVRVPLVKA